MKKIISLVLSLCMLMTLTICVNAASFTDLASNHWAYDNINTLVSEGTINGYSDGTFKPSKSVTRAEFVKMIGKWDRQYNGKYNDLSENHWAYEYIMWSGLDSDGESIYPDKEIKRSDVINLIWKRNGSPKHNLAPGVISRQGTNSDATSWAYTIGLMKGDDGLNLRLDSSLTRAEAATLIVRSREVVKQNAKNNFVDTINQDILKTTYEMLDLLGDTYNPNKTLTYGEVARMAIVFAADGKDINFVGKDLLDSKNNVMKPLNHEYDNEMFILSANVWGEKYYTLEKINAPATKQDTIAAIMYGFMRRGTLPSDFGKRDSLYPDCKISNDKVFVNMFLTYANLNGVKNTASDKLGANEPVTVRDYSAFMVQLNDAIGLAVCYNNGNKIAAKANINVATLPENYKEFKYAIDGAPAALYNLINGGVSAKSTYKNINLLSSTYNGYLSEVANLAKKATGHTFNYTLYPSLSYKQDGNVVFVAKFEANKNSGENTTISVDSMFSNILKAPTGYTANVNDDIYVVFETYGPIMDVYLPYSGAYAKAIFVK